MDDDTLEQTEMAEPPAAPIDLLETAKNVLKWTTQARILYRLQGYTRISGYGIVALLQLGSGTLMQTGLKPKF